MLAGGRKRKPSEAPGTSPAPSETADGRKRKRVKTTEEPFEESGASSLASSSYRPLTISA